MIASPSTKPKKMPASLMLVISFLFALALCQIASLLNECVRAGAIHQELLMRIMMRGLLALLALLLAVQLLLHVPLARPCALLLLVCYPAVTAFRYVLFPLRWQALSDAARFQEFTVAAVFLGMAFLLLGRAAGEYLR
jgi:hypothetical protein